MGAAYTELSQLTADPVHGPTQTTEFFKDYLRVILGCGRLTSKIILTTIYSSIDVITIFSYKIFFPFIII